MALINGTFSNDILRGTDGVDTINGLSGNDLIYISLGADTLNGGSGNDQFVANAIGFTFGSSSNGLIDGGDGFDTIDLSGISSGYLYTSNGTPTLSIGSQQYIFSNIENIILTSNADYISFVPEGVELHAGRGNDEFNIRGYVKAYGDEGDDTFFVSGSFGGERISGGVIDGGAGYNTLKTNISFDVNLETGVSTGGGASYIIKNIDNVLVTTGGYYTSTVVGNGSNNVFGINPLFAKDDNGSIGLTFDGRGGNDILTGSNGNDSLSGGDGNDIIDGRGGNDVIDGGMGDDRIIFSAGADRIDGGAGIDTLVVSGLTRAQSISLSNGGGTVGSSTVSNVETFIFRDGTLTFDQESVAAQVYRLYDSAFGRAPDYFGGQGWIDAVSSGLSLNTVSGLFVSSIEFQSRTAGMSNAQLVDYVYGFTLHREADLVGRAGWIAYLDAGNSLGDMMLLFSESIEHKANTASSIASGIWDGNKAYETVEFLYDAVFGRRPDAGGLINWASYVESGATVRDLASLFIKSDEYRSNTAGMTNEKLVEYTYQTALHRAPDPGGKAGWVNYLENGGTVAELVAQFAMSQELMSNNIRYVDHGIVIL